eukprot:TRINITY_DN8159_c0_g4_i1.p1 TRINITY_DN8159_c0_g4~~TRINITY_DN8159_c0_g4_i1.p1  ORF type:complete len:258 (-),score=50.24 TRINITY_DN8159_c0_g4_i1:37-726(-)
MSRGPSVGTSEVFKSYEEEFRQLMASIQPLAAVAEGSGPSRERIDAAREVAEAHEKASQALKQMELEVKSMGPLGVPLAGKLKEFKHEIIATRTLIRECQARLKREGLGIDSVRNSPEDKAANDAYNRLRSGSRRLDDSRRTALESEEIGLNVMSDLHSQRESLMRTKGHLLDVDENLSMSKRVLNTISHHAWTNEVLVWSIAVVLFIVLMFVIYLKIQKVLAVIPVIR